MLSRALASCATEPGAHYEGNRSGYADGLDLGGCCALCERTRGSPSESRARRDRGRGGRVSGGSSVARGSRTP